MKLKLLSLLVIPVFSIGMIGCSPAEKAADEQADAIEEAGKETAEAVEKAADGAADAVKEAAKE